MRNIHLKSEHHIRFENGEMSKNSPVKIRRDVFAQRDEKNTEIYHIYIKDVNDNFIMEPKAMKVIENKMIEVTLEGISLNDPDNRWGLDFSNYAIKFTLSALSGLTGESGTAILVLKDRNISIAYQ